MNNTHFLQQILHYATLPGAAGLFCVLVFMWGERRRGQLMMLSLSAAVSLNLLLKEFFKVLRPWWPDVSTAPYLAEGSYALPCLHTMLTAAILTAFALTSGHKPVRFLCAAGIWLTASVRVLTGLQSIADVLNGAVCGILIASALCRFWFQQGNATCTHRHCIAAITPLSAFTLIMGSITAVSFQNGWGLGACLTAILLDFPKTLFRKAEAGRTTFGRIYGTVFAAGIYTGLYILLPFLIEWLITPRWPGQTLIALLITLIPCLLRLFPIF